MQPIISIVGKSNSGKTTLLEGLISSLKQRGYKVAVLKHAGEDVELDTVNKDTWRFSQAGSELSAISSAHKLALFRRADHDLGPQDLANFICGDYDVILTEGFKKGDYLKIEVHRKEQGNDMVSPPAQLLAVVTDEPLPVNVPQFPKEEAGKVADLIEKIVTDGRKTDDVDLFLNNSYVPLEQPIRNLLYRTLIAIASSLRGTKEAIKSLRISLRRQT